MRFTVNNLKAVVSFLENNHEDNHSGSGAMFDSETTIEDAVSQTIEHLRESDNFEEESGGDYMCVNCGGGFTEVFTCEERDADFCKDCY